MAARGSGSPCPKKAPPALDALRSLATQRRSSQPPPFISKASVARGPPPFVPFHAIPKATATTRGHESEPSAHAYDALNGAKAASVSGIGRIASSFETVDFPLRFHVGTFDHTASSSGNVDPPPVGRVSPKSSFSPSPLHIVGDEGFEDLAGDPGLAVLSDDDSVDDYNEWIGDIDRMATLGRDPYYQLYTEYPLPWCEDIRYAGSRTRGCIVTLLLEFIQIVLPLVHFQFQPLLLVQALTTRGRRRNC